jgi:hypothetical protein
MWIESEKWEKRKKHDYSEFFRLKGSIFPEKKWKSGRACGC